MEIGTGIAIFGMWMFLAFVMTRGRVEFNTAAFFWAICIGGFVTIACSGN